MSNLPSRRAMHRRARLFTGVMLALLAGACAAARAPDTGRPRAANEPDYPVLLGGGADRRARALSSWATLTNEQGLSTAPAPALQPVTATVRELPALETPLRLPQIGGGDGKKQTDEELRESLREFIANTRGLLGVDPQFISLIGVVDGDGDTQHARYRQRPFLYPLRGGYGDIEITFTPDRQVVQLTSTALPDAARVRRALDDARRQISAADAGSRLAGRNITYTDAAGQTQTTTLPDAANEMTPRELVVYPLRRAGDADTLALHLAWEVVINARPGAAALLVYVDAVSGEVIAATSQTSPDTVT
ncbi:MAG: hypothetical protein H0W76_06250 [Pyrinomonadaceae bacterium]|nr:hypothetical protein [Pyrinomonadaceae bacterium]